MADIFADVVVAIPFGNEGKKRYRKVGVMMQAAHNDEKRGPGFYILLDRDFNPAGVLPVGGGGNSISLSTYWPKEFESSPTTPPSVASKHPRHSDLDLDDDIPF